ncbi:MAG TPA: hypothetical protein PLH36_14240, partial [Armatimonadota bacterium]|nr:hypothetical protein [Armatimonadota bacterium]
MDMASDRPGDYSTGAGLEASPGRGALPWETTEAALAGARVVRAGAQGPGAWGGEMNWKITEETIRNLCSDGCR